jgi:acid stress-induced BolA-like protein IbaG/YrbA
MDLEQKVKSALTEAFAAERVELDAEGGISGIVIAAAFRGHESLERQTMLYAALREHGLNEDEIREVIMVSALTPEEAADYSTLL